MAQVSSADVSAALDQQRALYGEPLGELVGRLRETFGLTQARFAGVLGLSAPMLSQLSSGQRVKIGNPAVVRRLEALVELADRAQDLPGEEVAARIEHIAQDTTTLASTRRSPVEASEVREALRRLAAPEALRAAAHAVEQNAPRLAEVLREAADG